MVQAPSNRLPWAPVLALWLAVSAILIYSGWDHIILRSGWDPDDQLRMVQLRDFLNGQSWFDVTQYRMNGDLGAPMHWSRLVELPLALIILLLAPITGQAAAEMVAGAIVPLCGLGLTALIIGRIAARLASREAGLVAVLITLISPPVLMQFRPMRIDHHGWQIVMAVLALWTIFWPGKKQGGVILGLALAIWLHISLEGAPMTAAFFLLLGWRWIFEKAHGQRLIWTIISFALSSFALFIATQAAGLSAPVYCDTISPPHIAAIAAAAAIMLPAIIAEPNRRFVRLAVAAAAGMAALAVLFWLAPSCRAGAFGNLDPLVRDYWYLNVNEGLPVWYQKPGSIAAFLAAPLCGLAALIFMLRQPACNNRSELHIAGFFMIYALVLSVAVFRTISVAVTFAIPVIAAWIIVLFGHYRSAQTPMRRILMVAAMLLLLVPGAIAGQIMQLAAPPRAAGKSAAESKKCQSVSSIAALGKLPKSRFLAPFDMGPAILLTTPHEVLSSSHHRNEAAMHDHIAIFLSEPGKARAIIAKHKITHLALCKGEAELNNYARGNPGGLWSRLDRGNAPGWLQPMHPMGANIQIWRVKI